MKKVAGVIAVFAVIFLCASAFRPKRAAVAPAAVVSRLGEPVVRDLGRPHVATRAYPNVPPPPPPRSTVQVFTSNTPRAGELDPTPDGKGPFPRRWDDLTPAQKEKFPRDSGVAKMVALLAALDDCLGDRLGDHRGGMLLQSVYQVEPDGVAKPTRVEALSSTLPSADDDNLVLGCLDQYRQARGPQRMSPEILAMRPAVGEEFVVKGDLHFPVKSDPWYAWLASQ